MRTLVRTAIWALVGASAFVLLRDKFRRPNRLFLYSYHRIPYMDADEGLDSVAGVATISPELFQLETRFRFGDWTMVVSAANRERKWIFCHNFHDGSAATGYIDLSFRYKRLKDYPPGSFTDWPWHQAVVNGLGDLLLIGVSSASNMPGPIVGHAQVLVDGTLLELFRMPAPVPLPSLIDSRVIGLPRAHAWFSPDKREGPPGGGTIYVFDAKHGQVLSTFKTEIDWKLASEGDLVYLYDDWTGRAQVCALNGAQQLIPLTRADFDFTFGKNPFNHVASTPGAHLGYKWGETQAAVHILNPKGFPATYAFNDLARYWHVIIPC